MNYFWTILISGYAGSKMGESAGQIPAEYQWVMILPFLPIMIGALLFIISDKTNKKNNSKAMIDFQMSWDQYNSIDELPKEYKEAIEAGQKELSND